MGDGLLSSGLPTTFGVPLDGCPWMGGRGASLAEALRGRRIRTRLMKITSLVDIIMSVNDDMMIYVGYAEALYFSLYGARRATYPFP